MDRPTAGNRGVHTAKRSPAIDVHDVLRAAAAGLRFLQWEDEDGLIIGHIATLDLTEDRYRFHSRFFGTRNVESGNGP